MVGRFDQARAYVRDAKNSLEFLRTTAYNNVQAAGELTEEFRNGVSKMLFCLRAALDRCACELFDRCVPAAARPNKKVKPAFPIAPKWKQAPGKHKGFRIWVNKD